MIGLLMIVGAVTLTVENGSEGAGVPDTLRAVVYRIGPNGGEPVETLRVVGAKAQIPEPEGAQSVGIEVLYGGNSFFSEPVPPGGQTKVVIYDAGGEVNALAVRLFNVAFFQRGDTVFVAEALHLENTGDRVITDQTIMSIPLPKGYEQFMFMGPPEDYLLINDTLYLKPRVLPGSSSVGFSYTMPQRFQWERLVTPTPDEFLIYADPNLGGSAGGKPSLSGKNIVAKGQENLGGMPLFSYVAQDPSKPVVVNVGAGGKPPWFNAMLLAVLALVVVIVAWFLVKKYTRRRRLLADLGELEFLASVGEVDEEEYNQRRAALLEEIEGLGRASEEEAEEETQEPQEPEEEKPSE